MLEVHFSNYNTYSTDCLTQWDLNQVLNISGLTLSSAPTILFTNSVKTSAEPVSANISGGVITCEIPNGLLTDHYPITAYIRVNSGSSYTTVAKVKIPVEKATKPEDYIYLENIQVLTYEDIISIVNTKHKNLEERVDAIIANSQDTDGNLELLDIRLGADGHNYTTAGEAVREQFLNLIDKINNVSPNGITRDMLAFYGSEEKDDLIIDYQDLNFDEAITVNTFGSNIPLYAGRLSQFIPYSENSLSYYENHGDVITIDPRLGLDTDIYAFDSNKVYLGKISLKFKIIEGNNTLYQYIRLQYLTLPKKTAYIRIYARNEKYKDLADITIKLYRDFKNILSGKKYEEDFITELREQLGVDDYKHYNLVKDNIIFKPASSENEILGLQANWPTMLNHIPTDGILYMNVKSKDNFVAWYCVSGTSIYLYDSDKNFIKKVATKNGLVSDTLITTSYTDQWKNVGNSPVMGLKIETAENVKYVRFNFDGNYTTINSVKDTLVVSRSPLPITATPNDCYFGSQYMEENIGKISLKEIEKNSHYKFEKIGTLFDYPEGYPYNCHMQECLHYDINDDTFVCCVRNATSHGGATGPLYLVKLDATTRAVKSATYPTVGGLKIGWSYGFTLNSEGTYIIIAQYAEGEDRTTIHKFVSSDRGNTWTDGGKVTITDEDTATYNDGSNGHTYNPLNPTAKFFSIHRLNSGRLLGVYDDLVLGVNCKKSTGELVSKIAYSDDDGLTWTVVTVDSPSFDTCEQTFIEIDGVIVAYCRENAYGQTSPAYLMYSYDDGLTWTPPVKSYSLTKMNCSNACGFVHGNIVEVFTANRTTSANTQKNSRIKAGALYHYSATLDQALNDNYTLREVFYNKSNTYSDFTAPACAINAEDDVLVVYPESQYGNSNPTQWTFLKRSDNTI